MVEKHIKSLLYDHDCVIIPDFGGLITRYVSARINPVKHSFLPPSKKVAFNEKLILNDGLLVSTISYRDKITKEEAQQQVTNFVREARAALQAHNSFVLHGIGVFKYNAERRLEFEFTEAENLLEASFGLPELTARPIKVEEPAVLRTLLKERQQEPVQAKQPFKKRLKRAYNIAAGLALTGLSVSALYFLSLQADYNLSSLNPLGFFNQSFASSNTLSVDRFAKDYIPFTEEERLVNYHAIMPAAIPVDELVDESGFEVEDSFDNVSDSLSVAADVVANEVVALEEAVEEKPKTIEPVLTIKEKTGRFYIITGGYSTNDNAETSRDAISVQGYNDAKVLFPGRGSKLYRVSVADYTTEQEARAALDQFRNTFGETIWVFNY